MNLPLHAKTVVQEVEVRLEDAETDTTCVQEGTHELTHELAVLVCCVDEGCEVWLCAG